MIKSNLIALMLLLCCVSESSAQLTNGQVYNYEVGDVHQIRGVAVSGGGGSVMVQTDTILYKSYSVGLDSITYHIKRLNYYGQGGMPPTYDEFVDTFLVTNLNQPADHYIFNSCLPPTLDSLTDTCGVYYERLSSNFDTSCFEPNMWYSDLRIGLGGPYHYEDNTVGGYTVTRELIYHNTVQHGECGTPATFAGLNNLALNKLKVYPNPSNGEITVDLANTNGENYRISIVNLSGVELENFNMDSESETINLKLFSSGVYFVMLKSGEGVVARKRIVLN